MKWYGAPFKKQEKWCGCIKGCQIDLLNDQAHCTILKRANVNLINTCSTIMKSTYFKYFSFSFTSSEVYTIINLSTDFDILINIKVHIFWSH